MVNRQDMIPTATAIKAIAISTLSTLGWHISELTKALHTKKIVKAVSAILSSIGFYPVYVEVITVDSIKSRDGFFA